MIENCIFRKKVIEKQLRLLNRAFNVFDSQTALANKLGITRQQVSRYYSGAHEMKWSMYLKIDGLLKEKR